MLAPPRSQKSAYRVVSAVGLAADATLPFIPPPSVKAESAFRFEKAE
jgi:hypothetical protein